MVRACADGVGWMVNIDIIPVAALKGTVYACVLMMALYGNEHGNLTKAESGKVIPVALEIVVVEVIAVFSFVGNSLVLAAIARFRRLRTSSNTFVANLSIADGMFGVLLWCLPMNIVHNR